jgi:hypothetical protein
VSTHNGLQLVDTAVSEEFGLMLSSAIAYNQGFSKNGTLNSQTFNVQCIIALRTQVPLRCLDFWLIYLTNRWRMSVYFQRRALVPDRFRVQQSIFYRKTTGRTDWMKSGSRSQLLLAS